MESNQGRKSLKSVIAPAFLPLGLVFAGFDWQGLLLALVGVIMSYIMKWIQTEESGGDLKHGAIGATVSGGAALGLGQVMAGGVPAGWEQVAISVLSFLISWLSRKR